MSAADDTIIDFTVVCSGCDALTHAADAFYLRTVNAARRHLPGTYCGECSDKWRRGEVLPKSRFPRLASFSMDGKTWTACDLRDTPS